MWILTFVKILLVSPIIYSILLPGLPILQDPTHIPVDPFTNSSTLDLYLSLRQTGSVVKNPPANAEDVGSVLGCGRSPEDGNGNLLQYSCLENPMDRGA